MTLEELKTTFPQGFYYLKNAQQKVTIHSWCITEENKPRLTVTVLVENNPSCKFDRDVFGIRPEDLEPWRD